MQGGPATSGATHMTSGGPARGSMLAEPSQKERRAQALHKYKEKRKVGQNARLPTLLACIPAYIAPA